MQALSWSPGTMSVVVNDALPESSSVRVTVPALHELPSFSVVAEKAA